MKSFFYSLKAGYLFFALLSLNFYTGSRLAGIKEYGTIFKNLTRTHLLHCLEAIAAQPVMVIWFLSFAVIGICLFINTWCCTTSQIKLLLHTRRQKKQSDQKQGKAMQMALIHVAALMVIALHALDITLVERHKPMRIYSGQTIQMGKYGVRVKQISFVSTRSLITEDKTGRKMKSVHIPGKKFSRQDNFVQIEITTSPGKKFIRELRMLDPVRIGATFFFLDNFFVAQGSDQVGIQVHHNYNPLAFVFFSVYIVLFCFLLFRFFTTRTEAYEKELL